MNQLAFELDPRQLARRTDPSTSHEAARRVREFAGGHALLILKCLRERGPLTPEQIETFTGIQAYAVRKRLPELLSHSPPMACPTGEIAPTRSGRRQRVWRAL